MNLYERVGEFMLRFGQARHLFGKTSGLTTHIGPQVPPDDVVRNRCKWQVEETLELLRACLTRDIESWERVAIEHARNVLTSAIEKGRVDVDLVEYADASADIRYVAYGNDIAAGIYSPDVDAEVCRSNDTKSPPGPDGKVSKGPSYSPPDIAGVLKEQGWKG